MPHQPKVNQTEVRSQKPHPGLHTDVWAQELGLPSPFARAGANMNCSDIYDTDIYRGNKLSMIFLED